MIEKSVFNNNEEIVGFIKNNYNLNIKKIVKLNRGSANIYLLDEKYILKEFQSKYNENDIYKEIIVINHLKKDNISVPVYLKNVFDNYSTIYKNKNIIIQKYIEGYTMNNNLCNYKQTIECATMYGRIINSLKTLNYELPVNNINDWYNKTSFLKGISKHKELLKLLKENEIDQKIKKDLLDKIDIINKIKNINFNDLKYITIMNSHGDYSLQQFIYKNDKIDYVIDFVSAAKMPIIWELIRSYSYIDKDVFNIENFIQYVKEFNKYVKLNKYDIKYICYIYLIQMLNSVYGYKQYIFDNNKKELLKFGIFRTNLCRYLFDNNEIIINRLKKEIDS